MAKLLFYIAEDWYFFSHRLPLAKAAIRDGFEVVLLTNVKIHGDLIKSEGIKVIPIALQRSSLNPIREIKTILRTIKIYNLEKPDIVHHVAMKPVLYGSIAAFISGVPRNVNALAGMGHLFISESFKYRAIRLFVKTIFKIFLNRKRSRLILQNPDDISMFLKYGLAKKSSICLIRGSGVNTSIFSLTIEPSHPIKVVLPARMLVDKGVREFVMASIIINKKGCIAKFILVGMCDPENPSSISEEQLRLWEQEKIIEWLGHQSDMPDVLSKSHIVCLPSYREGLPKSLLEAASCGRPIVTTDVPGCREVVRHNDNGLLVPPRDAESLADAILILINNPEIRTKMGNRGRIIVKKEFSEEIVIDQTMSIYKKLLVD